MLVTVSSCFAQWGNQTHAIEVTGDATVKVVPDEVRVLFGSRTAYSYGGGSSYIYCCGFGGYRYYGYVGAAQQQNVVQNVPGKSDGDSQATVSLGKISITASVTMAFQITQ
jgi:uncharacterized protein YggE